MHPLARLLPALFSIAVGCDNPAPKAPSGAVPAPVSSTASSSSSTSTTPKICTNGQLGAEGLTPVSARGTLRGATIAAPDGVDDMVAKPLCDAHPKVRACYDAALATTGILDGLAGVKFTIDHGGTVSAVEVDEPHFGDPPRESALKECLTAAYRSVALKVPAGVTQFAYMLRFAPPRTNGVSSKETPEAVVGKLPSEIVWRIVRAAIPKFRACYEAGIAKEPTLAGVVTTSFVIGSKGNVESATMKPSTLTDPTVQACMRTVYLSLEFPEPESGKVTVTHPVEFTNVP